MNATSSAQGVHRREILAANDSPRASTSDSLLPAPAGGGDPRRLLLLLNRVLLDKRDDQMQAGESRIEIQDQLREKAIEDAHQARLEEAEARSSSGGFFSGLGDAFEALTVDVLKGKSIGECLDKAADATIDNPQFWKDLQQGAMEVGKWAAVAGSVALAVVSCGSAAPIAALAIAGAAMSCAAAADSSFHVLEKCGVDKDVAGWIDVGLSVGGALCGGAAGLLTGSAVSGAAKTAGLAGEAVSIGAGIVGGTAKIVVGGFERDAMLAAADGEQAKRQLTHVDRASDRELEAMKETLDSCERGLQRTAEALNSYGTTSLNLVRG